MSGRARKPEIVLDEVDTAGQVQVARFAVALSTLVEIRQQAERAGHVFNVAEKPAGGSEKFRTPSETCWRWRSVEKATWRVSRLFISWKQAA